MSIFVFLLAVGMTQFGLATLESREERAVVQKAEIFLDTLAGSILPAAEQGETAVSEVLSEVVTFKPSLRDEAVSFCCFTAGAVIITETARGTETAALLGDHTLANADLSPNTSEVSFKEEQQKILLVRAFEEDGQRFVLGGAFDIEVLLGERQAARQAAIVIDVLLAVISAILVFAITRSSLKPIERLTKELATVGNGKASDADGDNENEQSNTEVGRLEMAIKRRLKEEDYKARLIAEASEKEQHRALAQLGAGLAHEVRNPLAGILSAISTLRRFGSDEKVRTETLDLMERGLNSIERVAATMLSTYRPNTEVRDLIPADIDDILLLIQPEIKKKNLNLQADNGLKEPFSTDADGVRQLLLNLLINACNAAPEEGMVGLKIILRENELSLQVSDNGPGLPDDLLAVITDQDDLPVPKNKRLGLWIISRIIDDLNGKVSVETRSGKGTSVTVKLPPLSNASRQEVDETHG